MYLALKMNANHIIPKISFLFILLFISVSLIHAQSVWNNTSFVHRDNQDIRDGQNNLIQLNGVDLGGWLLWEGWLWGGGFTQEKTIYNNIQSVVGASSATAFKDSVQKNFITRKDIQKISEECFNVVRIPSIIPCLKMTLHHIHTSRPDGIFSIAF